MKHDIFLGGPWEQYAPFPYKTHIKQAFPNKKCFDPETDSNQGTWFADNYEGIENSAAMVALVPSFPFPGVGPEVGHFYRANCKSDPTKPLENLVIIWPEAVKPDFGKEVATKMGYVVENCEQAIARLRVVLETCK